MSRLTRFFVLLLTTTLAVACDSSTGPEVPGGGDPGTDPPATGSLEVSLTGLPSGGAGSLAISGPGGYSQTVTSSGTLSGLTPGSYTVEASEVSDGGVAYDPAQASQTVSVLAEQTTLVVVDYVAQLGGLVLTVRGVPLGSDADIDVSGPNGFSQSVTSSIMLGDLPVGDYTITANAIMSGPDAYEATPSGSTVAVTFNAAPETVITYEIAASTLEVIVDGLSSGTDADIDVTGPGGFAASVSETTTLTNLAAGDYTVAANRVTGSGGTYTPTPLTQTVAVAGGAQETATVTYSSFALRADYGRLSGGKLHTCALDEAGAVLCWGTSNVGQLGTGETIDVRLTPVQVLPGPYVQIEAGGEFTCARTAAGAVDCWGYNYHGQIGSGAPLPDNSSTLSPSRVRGGHDFTQIALSPEGSHACGIDDSGAAWCWGRNVNGQLGDGTQTDRSEPVAVSGGHTFTQIDVGSEESCALDTDGYIWCWGNNSIWQLGTNAVFFSTTPLQVSGGMTFATLGRGGAPCALTDGGLAYCWSNDFLLGVSSHVPAQMADGRSFVQLVKGVSYACGLDAAGVAWCWGWNNNGALGDGTFTTRGTAAPVQGGHTFTDLAPGPRHMCGVDDAGVTWCWGNNYDGQLGNGERFTTEALPLRLGDLN